MPRDLPVGNGNIFISFDKDYLLREFYYPYVGQENHTSGRPFRFGVWVNGDFSWVPDGWRIKMDYLDDTLVTNVELVHDNWKLRIYANDLVDFHENIYVKKLVVENFSSRRMEVRLFLAHNFHIFHNDIGDTAIFRPDVNGLLHYKLDRYFLINIFANKKSGIDYFAAGNKGRPHQLGTWKDAEDGVLSGNPVAQGSVDSVAAIHLDLNENESDTCYYWICAGKDWKNVETLNSVILKKTPEEIIKRTVNYWKLWVDKEELNYDLLPPEIGRLYKRSLLICRSQINNNGSIIAANDSDAEYFNRDTYSYMWPRDAALAAYALDLAGYFEITRNFYNLCADIIVEDGYFFHKYNPSGSIASSWHPWQKDNKPQLPIQEDETALVIWALWNNFYIFRETELIKPLYKPLIKNAADFMMNYRDSGTGLPLPSYDLWEERQGILTFTTAAVYGGLMAAANFTNVFGDVELAEEYRNGAQKMRRAMDKYLYLEQEKRFCRMINFKKDGSIEIDKTIDASLYGIFAFGAYEPDDEKVANTMQQVYDNLWCKTKIGGLARYENDPYYRISQNTPGNPWFLCTLWLAQYYIAGSRSKDDLNKAMEIMQWVQSRALPSGVLAEQVNPETNEPISVSPLTWSHAAFIAAVQQYLNKLIDLEKCPSCGMAKYSKKMKKI
ncbi:MAG: glycoside hydrolase family 15 [Planctomycetes bacterium GWF2_41_51]|nr:MAG: glycoside hydrolase family 15 [Planctomycetes bacterium GWF2_41_51]HBG25794.1 glycoside hydrolase family 15 [Phycisphaerales bacterium]